MSYERDIIVPGSLRAVEEGVYSLDLRLAYYRALGLTMVEDLAVRVDSKTVERDDVSFVSPMGTHSLAALATLDEERWPFTEARSIIFRAPSDMTTGLHLIAVTERLRISYMGTGLVASDEKWMSVSGA